MNTKIYFLIEFHIQEGRIIERMELAKLKGNKEVINTYVWVRKILRKLQADLRDEIFGSR